MELTKSQTLKNLLNAIAGEAISVNIYSLYADKAAEEGYVQIADVFRETAGQEKIHSEVLYRLAGESDIAEVSVSASMPFGISDTLSNLTSSVREEQFRHTVMYQNFAKVALQEEFEDISNLLRNLAVAEMYHQKRFASLLELLESGRLFRKTTPVLWRCRKCGFVGEYEDAPDMCPVCSGKQGNFEALMNNLFA